MPTPEDQNSPKTLIDLAKIQHPSKCERVSNIPRNTLKFLDSLFLEKIVASYDPHTGKVKEDRLSTKKSDQLKLFGQQFPDFYLASSMYRTVDFDVCIAYFIDILHKRQGIPETLTEELQQLYQNCMLAKKCRKTFALTERARMNLLESLSKKFTHQIQHMKVGHSFLLPGGISSSSVCDPVIIRMYRQSDTLYDIEFWSMVPTLNPHFCSSTNYYLASSGGFMHPMIRFNNIQFDTLFFSNSSSDRHIGIQSLIEGFAYQQYYGTVVGWMNHVVFSLFHKDSVGRISDARFRTPLLEFSIVPSNSFSTIWAFVRCHIRDPQVIARIERDFSLNIISTLQRYRKYWNHDSDGEKRPFIMNAIKAQLYKLMKTWPEYESLAFQYDILNHSMKGLQLIHFQSPDPVFKPLSLVQQNSSAVLSNRIKYLDFSKTRNIRPRTAAQKTSYSSPPDSISFNGLEDWQKAIRWLSNEKLGYGNYEQSQGISTLKSVLIKIVDCFEIPEISADVDAESYFPAPFYRNLAGNPLTSLRGLFRLLKIYNSFFHGVGIFPSPVSVGRLARIMVAIHQMALVVELSNGSLNNRPHIFNYGILNPLGMYNEHGSQISEVPECSLQYRQCYQYFFAYNSHICKTKFEGNLAKFQQLFLFWDKPQISSKCDDNVMVRFYAEYHDKNTRYHSRINRAYHPKLPEYHKFTARQTRVMSMVIDAAKLHIKIGLEYFYILRDSLFLVFLECGGSRRQNTSYTYYPYPLSTGCSISGSTYASYSFSMSSSRLELHVTGTRTHDSNASCEMVLSSILQSKFAFLYPNSAIPYSHEAVALSNSKNTKAHEIMNRLFTVSPNLRAHQLLTYYFSHVSTLSESPVREFFRFMFFKHLDPQEFCSPENTLVQKLYAFCKKGLCYFYLLQPDQIPVLLPSLFFIGLMCQTKYWVPGIDITEFTCLLDRWFPYPKFGPESKSQIFAMQVFAAFCDPSYFCCFGRISSRSLQYKSTYLEGDTLIGAIPSFDKTLAQSGYDAAQQSNPHPSSSDELNQETKNANNLVLFGVETPKQIPSELMQILFKPDWKTTMRSYGHFLNMLSLHIQPDKVPTFHPLKYLRIGQKYYSNLFHHYFNTLKSDLYSCRLATIDLLEYSQLWPIQLDMESHINDSNAWNHSEFPRIRVNISAEDYWIVDLWDGSLFNRDGIFRKKASNDHSEATGDIIAAFGSSIEFETVGIQGPWNVYRVTDNSTKELIRTTGLRVPYRKNAYWRNARRFEKIIHWQCPHLEGGGWLMYLPSDIFQLNKKSSGIPPHLFLTSRAWISTNSTTNSKIYFISNNTREIVAILDSTGRISSTYQEDDGSWTEIQFFTSIASRVGYCFSVFESPGFINVRKVTHNVAKPVENYATLGMDLKSASVGSSFGSSSSSSNSNNNNGSNSTTASTSTSTSTSTTTNNASPPQDQSVPQSYWKVSFPRYASFSGEPLSFTSKANDVTTLIWDQNTKYKIQLPFPTNQVSGRFSNYIPLIPVDSDSNSPQKLLIPLHPFHHSYGERGDFYMNIPNDYINPAAQYRGFYNYHEPQLANVAFKKRPHRYNRRRDSSTYSKMFHMFTFLEMNRFPSENNSITLGHLNPEGICFLIFLSLLHRRYSRTLQLLKFLPFGMQFSARIASFFGILFQTNSTATPSAEGFITQIWLKAYVTLAICSDPSQKVLLSNTNYNNALSQTNWKQAHIVHAMGICREMNLPLYFEKFVGSHNSTYYYTNPNHLTLPIRSIYSTPQKAFNIPPTYGLSLAGIPRKRHKTYRHKTSQFKFPLVNTGISRVLTYNKSSYNRSTFVNIYRLIQAAGNDPKKLQVLAYFQRLGFPETCSSNILNSILKFYTYVAKNPPSLPSALSGWRSRLEWMQETVNKLAIHDPKDDPSIETYRLRQDKSFTITHPGKDSNWKKPEFETISITNGKPLTFFSSQQDLRFEPILPQLAQEHLFINYPSPSEFQALKQAIKFQSEMSKPTFTNATDNPFLSAIESELKNFEFDCEQGFSRICKTEHFDLKYPTLDGIQKIMKSIQSHISTIATALQEKQDFLLGLANRIVTTNKMGQLQFKVLALIGALTPITLDDLIEYFLKQKKTNYEHRNPALMERVESMEESDRLHILFSETGNYLLFATCIQRLQRSFELCESIQKILSSDLLSKDPSRYPKNVSNDELQRLIRSEDIRFQFLVQQLGFLFTQTRSYNLARFPSFLVFEFRNNLTLRPKQGKLIMKLLDFDDDAANANSNGDGDSDDDPITDPSIPPAPVPPPSTTPSTTLSTTPSASTSLNPSSNKNKNFKSSVSQLMMGQGKTSIFIPLLCYEICLKNKIPLVICPQSQFNTVLERLRKTLNHSFSLPIVTFNATRSTLVSQLKDINKMVQFLKDYGGVLMLQRETIQGIRLEFEANAIKSNPSMSHAQALNTLLKFLKNSTVAIIDEIDDVLDARCLLNFAAGQVKHVEDEHNDIAKAIFSLLIVEPVNSILRLDSNDQSLVNSIDYEQHIVQFVADKMFGLLKQPIATMAKKLISNPVQSPDSPTSNMSLQDIFIGYVTQTMEGNSYEELNFLKQLVDFPKKFHEIECLRKMLTQVLPTTLRRSGGRHYGRLPNHSYGKVVPYSFGQPTGREFGDPYEALAYHFATACHFGITENQLESYATHVLKRARETMKSQQCRLAETIQAKKFFQLTLVSLEDWELEEQQIAALKYINDPEHLQRRLVVEHHCASICVSFHSERLSASPQMLVSLIGPVIGFSGTPWNIEGYPESLSARRFLDPGTEGKIAVTLLQRNSTIHSMQKRDPLELFQELGKKTSDKSQLKGFVDAGALFKDHPDQKVAEAILAWRKQDTLFFEDNLLAMLRPQPNEHDGAETPIIHIGSTREEKIAQSGVEMDKAFVFLALAYISGTDITQTPLANYCISIDNQLNRRSLLQAVLRLRQFFFYQNVEFCLPEIMKGSVYNGAQSIRDILLYSSKNQAIRKSKDFFRSIKQQIDQVFRDLMWNQTVPSLKPWAKKWKMFFCQPLSTLPAGVLAAPCATLGVVSKYAETRLNKCPLEFRQRANKQIAKILKRASENAFAPASVPGNINQLLLGSEIEVELEVIKELVDLETRVLSQGLQEEYDHYMKYAGKKWNIETNWDFAMIYKCIRQITQNEIHPTQVELLQWRCDNPNSVIPEISYSIDLPVCSPNPNTPLVGLSHPHHCVRTRIVDEYIPGIGNISSLLPSHLAQKNYTIDYCILSNQYIPPLADFCKPLPAEVSVEIGSDIPIPQQTQSTWQVLGTGMQLPAPVSSSSYQVSASSDLTPNPDGSQSVVPIQPTATPSNVPQPGAVEIEENVFVNPDGSLVFVNPNDPILSNSSQNIATQQISFNNPYVATKYEQLKPKFTFIGLRDIFVPTQTKFKYKKAYGGIFSEKIYCSYNFLFTTNTLLPVFQSITRYATQVLVIENANNLNYFLLSQMEAQAWKYFLDEAPHPKVTLVTSDGSPYLRYHTSNLVLDKSIFIQLNVFNGNIRYLRANIEQFMIWLDKGKTKLKIRFLKLKCNATKDEQYQMTLLMDQINQLKGQVLDEDM